MDERDNFYVPYDIIRNILVRLPVKSLLRFKTVSKIFLIIISDPKFVSAHLYHSKILASQNLFVQKDLYWDGQVKLIKIRNRRCRVASRLQYPLKEYGPPYTLCGCDGLLILFCGYFLHDSLHMLFLLCNPSTKTFKPFWSPRGFVYRGRLYFGLCYDSLIEDYKFVATNMREYSAVFYCRNKQWIERQVSLFDGKIRVESLCQNTRNQEGVCFDGTLYWLLHDHGQRRYEIVCFGSSDHKYRMMHKPESLQNPTHGQWQMDLFGGNLCLSHTLSYDSLLRIFTLKKHDDRDIWIEFITIDLSRVPMFFRYAVPVLLTKKNEIILSALSFFVVYNVRKKTFAELETREVYLNSMPYVENIFAMEE